MSPAADKRLAGVREKIKRANKHITDLIPLINAFSDGYRNCVRADDDPQTGDKIYRTNLAGVPAVGDIPLVIGDAVHNLRSSLDHLTWQLVEANHCIPDDKTAYPLCGDAKAFKSKSTKGKTKGIHQDAINIIETTQPYQAGYNNLGRLRDFDNFDKHQLLVVAVGRLVLPVGPGIIIPAAIVPNSGVKDGEELFRVVAGNQNANVNFGFTIALREPQVVQGEPVIEFLTQLSQLVENVVNRFLGKLA